MTKDTNNSNKDSNHSLLTSSLINGSMWATWFTAWYLGYQLSQSIDAEQQGSALPHCLIMSCIAVGSIIGSSLTYVLTIRNSTVNTKHTYIKLCGSNLAPDIIFYLSDQISTLNWPTKVLINTVTCGMTSATAISITQYKFNLANLKTGMCETGASAAAYTIAYHFSPTNMIAALPIFIACASIPLLNFIAAMLQTTLVNYMTNNPADTSTEKNDAAESYCTM